MKWIIVIKWISYIGVLISALSLEGSRKWTWEYFSICFCTIIYGLCCSLRGIK